MRAVRTLGIDPGLRSAGYVALAGDTIVHHATLRPVEAWAKDTLFSREVMRREIARLIGLVSHDVLAIETYEDRPWLGRRVNRSVDMGWLCGRLEAAFPDALWVPAAESKTGWPKTDDSKAWKRLVPELRNGHERSAYMVARWAQGIARRRRA